MLPVRTNTHNDRIERWWDLLQGGQLRQWREMLNYAVSGEYSIHSKWDRMAILYVYMVTLREHATRFVKVHNDHVIRSQRKRQYLPVGRLSTLYYAPQQPIVSHALDPDMELLAEMLAELEGYDPDIYLSNEVLEVCENIMQFHGLPLKPPSILRNDNIRRQMYNTLRHELKQYEKSGDLLPEVKPPKGGKEWTWKNVKL